MSAGSDLIAQIAGRQNLADYQKKHWHGTFADYLDIVRRDPKVTRTAYQRVYDMILSHGTEEVLVNKEKQVRYKFFDDPVGQGQDAIFGLDRTLMNLVNVLKSAAHGTAPSAGSCSSTGRSARSKSTIARLLKKGLEHYSKTDDGALYTYGWREEGLDGADTYVDCPMHEEPLHLVPTEFRAELIDLDDRRGETTYPITIEGDLCPFCRQTYNERMAKYDGDWSKVLADIRVRRLILSEQDRVGDRHLPAQGREEPGRHRADRRHQLPEDRRVRHRERPPRLQLRRRIQHRQPRDHRVHRGPQARRRLPLRPPGSQPGAQDQAQEVRPDRHR